jgi:hypothetical protein
MGMIISLVDIGEGDGSDLFLGHTGVPFPPPLNGTFSMGVNYAAQFQDNRVEFPDFDHNAK